MSQLQLFQNHFYNTISLSEEELVKEEVNAISQEEKIYSLFKIYQRGTPSAIMKLYEERWPAIPITSVRRSLTNLTKENRLVMTDTMLTGLYNKPEHVWRINE
jgi:tRNA(Leu) C34 or U34 (ribose-2'-O)-methylase TrmL